MTELRPRWTLVGPLWCAVWAIGSGCYQPSPAVGLPCSEARQCPDGQYCGSGDTCRLLGDPGTIDAAPFADASTAPDAAVCERPALPEILPGGSVTGVAADDFATIEKSATINGNDLLIAALNKSEDPWGGPLSSGTYSFDLTGSCLAGSKTCVTIDADDPTSGALRRHVATSGTMRVTVLQDPNPPADPDNCSAHDGGDVAGCDGEAACAYFFCSATCRPEQPAPPSLCDAECARGCGFTMTLEDAVLTDDGDQSCSTMVDGFTLE